LHRQRLAAYATVMTTHAARLSQAWQDGDTLDITPAMMRVTLAIAAHTLLEADVDAEASAIGQAITTLVQGSARVPLPLAPLVRRLPLPSQRRLRRAEAYLDTLIYQLIDARRVQGGEKGDVLTMLLDARTEDGRPLSPRQIHDEALVVRKNAVASPPSQDEHHRAASRHDGARPEPCCARQGESSTGQDPMGEAGTAPPPGVSQR